jgi:hypothetical protein
MCLVASHFVIITFIIISFAITFITNFQNSNINFLTWNIQIIDSSKNFQIQIFLKN